MAEFSVTATSTRERVPGIIDPAAVAAWMSCIFDGEVLQAGSHPSVDDDQREPPPPRGAAEAPPSILVRFFGTPIKLTDLSMVSHS